MQVIMSTNVLKGLEGLNVPSLKEFQVPKSRIVKYDEAKLTKFIDKLFFLWEFQPKLIEFYSNLLESLVGKYSQREMFDFSRKFTFSYTLFASPHRFVASETHKRVVSSFQSVQDVSLFDRILDSLEKLIDVTLLFSFYLGLQKRFA